MAHQRGVGLVEVLMAVAMFVIASGGIVAAHLNSQGLADHATDTLQAISHLEALMEHIYATPFATLPTHFPDGVVNGGGASDYAALVGGYTLEGEQIVVTYPSAATGRLELLATVQWVHRNRPRTTSLSTVRTSG